MKRQGGPDRRCRRERCAGDRRGRPGRFCAGAAVLLALLGACSNRLPAPDWQAAAKTASERAVAAYLAGNARVEAAEVERARAEVRRTGRVDLLARVELAQCAARVASLVFEACAGFEALRADAPAAERAYADYLALTVTAADLPLLPPAQRSAAGTAVVTPAVLLGIDDPLSRLIAAGVAFGGGRADPQAIATAVETASAQGWRRPLMAWLGVQLRRAEKAGADTEAARLRRRLALVAGEGG